MSKAMKVGDYVLATKYHDGDPHDHFYVGFFSRMMGDRYIVVDNEGSPARASGFRRAEKISPEVGSYIVLHAYDIEEGGRGLWSIKHDFAKRKRGAKR